MSELPLEKWKELARRDDWHVHLVGSDIRQMICEIERLRRDVAFQKSLVEGYKALSR